ASDRRRQRTGDDQRTEARHPDERCSDEQSEQPTEPGARGGSARGDVACRQEAVDLPLVREVSRQDRDLADREAVAIESANGLLRLTECVVDTNDALPFHDRFLARGRVCPKTDPAR